MTRPNLPFELAVLLLACLVRPAVAYHLGISGYSGEQAVICTACHSGGSVPTVSLSGPTMLGAGATGTFTFTVQSLGPVQKGAGLDVAASDGNLIAGSGTQLLNGEVTHTMPKRNNASGTASWTFKWKAPSTPGNYALWGAGNSVNLDATTNGDNAAGTMIFIAVGGVDTVTPTVPSTPSPTRTLSPTPAPSSPSATPSPTDTPTNSRVSTATPTATATPMDSSTPTATAPSTATPTDTSTSSPTDTQSPTPTPTSTPTEALVIVTRTATPSCTPTPTVTPFPATPGDANCDDRVSAPDLSAIVIQLGSGGLASCGGDANTDGTLDDADVETTIHLIFAQ